MSLKVLIPANGIGTGREDGGVMVLGENERLRTIGQPQRQFDRIEWANTTTGAITLTDSGVSEWLLHTLVITLPATTALAVRINSTTLIRFGSNTNAATIVVPLNYIVQGNRVVVDEENAITFSLQYQKIRMR